MFKFFTWAAALSLSLSALAAEKHVPDVLLLGGHEYQLALESNERLGSKLRGAGHDSATHYRGQLLGVDDSWVRMSLVNGVWSGLASIGQQAYIISQTAQRSDVQHSSKSAAAFAPNDTLTANPAEQLPHTQCGSKDPHSDHSVFDSSRSLSAHSVFEQPSIARADLSELCATTVDGVCMLAEIEFVFDQEFQSLLSNPQATATSIINMVEGYYSESFNIEFDVISTEFLSSQVFTSSTDPDVLLGGTDAMHPVEDPTSIRAMSANNQLPFETSKPALLHLITGRNFDGGTAGIAFTDVLCNSNGFASGTSQLIGVGSGDEASITAMIVAHEIGHNFGANHDSLDNSCATGFLMEPSLSMSTAGFSSCSVSEVDASIDRLPSLGQCFNFPADVSITADAANATSATIGEEFPSRFNLNLEEASQAIPLLSVQGNVSDGSGTFTQVLLNGAACPLGAGSQSYTCSLDSPGSTATLEVSAIGNAASVSFQHSTNFAGSTELIETDSSNNTIDVTVTFTGSVPSPTPDPDPSQSGSGENANQAAAPADSGGGGSVGTIGLLILASGLFGVRTRRVGLAAKLVLPTGVFLLSACSQVAPLAMASESSYTVVQQKSCYCTIEYRRPIKVWVENGSVVDARYDDDGATLSDPVRRSVLSLEQWQSSIEQWQQRNPNRLEVSYDEATKTLSHFDFDPSAMKSDDEFSMSFTNYQQQQ